MPQHSTLLQRKERDQGTLAAADPLAWSASAPGGHAATDFSLSQISLAPHEADQAIGPPADLLALRADSGMEAPAAPSPLLIQRAARDDAAPWAQAGPAPAVDELLDGMPDPDALLGQTESASSAPEAAPAELAPLAALISGEAPVAEEQPALDTASTDQESAAPATQLQTSPAAAGDQDYAWRVAEDSGTQALIDEILARLRQYAGVTLRGMTPEQGFRRYILANRQISNDQLRAMTQVRLDTVEDSEEYKRFTLERFPDHLSSPVHVFTAALFFGVMGGSYTLEEISTAMPTLGVTGVPRKQLGLFRVFYVADSPYVQLSTALHDFTDTMRGAEVAGINEAVWGQEGQVASALQSWLWAQSERVKDLLGQVADGLRDVKDAVVETVGGWLNKARGWFGRFTSWLGASG